MSALSISSISSTRALRRRERAPSGPSLMYWRMSPMSLSPKAAVVQPLHGVVDVEPVFARAWST